MFLPSRAMPFRREFMQIHSVPTMSAELKDAPQGTRPIQTHGSRHMVMAHDDFASIIRSGRHGVPRLVP